MIRVWAILGFVALLFWVYAIVDVSAQSPLRHRGVSKPIWIVIVLLLPVIGGILWFVIGRTRRSTAATRRAPDDDDDFLGRIGSISDQDDRIRRLEEELAQLDAEGEDPRWATPDLPAASGGPVSDPPANASDHPEDDDTRGQRGAVG